MSGRVVPIGQVDVAFAVSAWAARPSASLRRILERDGQIVPLLVTEHVREGEVRYVATDSRQAERLGALRQLGWDTVLVETDWCEDDL